MPVQSGQCIDLPSGVGISEGDLDLAGISLGEFSLSKLSISYKAKFLELLSEDSKRALVIDTIACRSIVRAGVASDPEMVDYFNRAANFYFSKERTPQEQTEWHRNNPIPRKQGKMDLSGLKYDDSKHAWRLTFSSKTPTRTIGVVNAGETDLTWWYGDFPNPIFYSSFKVGQKNTLRPSESFPVELVLQYGRYNLGDYHFSIRSSIGQKEDVLLEIAEDPYVSLGVELNARVRGDGTHFANLTNRSLVTAAARAMVDDKFNDSSETSKQVMVAQVLLAAQFPDAALAIVYATGGKGQFRMNLGSTSSINNLAKADTVIQHLKYSVWSGEYGESTNVLIHTQKALEAAESDLSEPPSPTTIIPVIRAAYNNAKSGNIKLGTEKADQALTELRFWPMQDGTIFKFTSPP